jgi:hypothetical protein
VHVAVRLGKVEVENGGYEQPSFSDREADTRYGYITVSSISKELIGFTYTEYAADGKASSSASFTVGLNDKADINGDGLPDITYVQPARKRPGMEKAVYLTFLSSQETLNTAMFAVLPEQYSRSVYPSGIIGINPDGRFIVSKYEGTTTNRAAVQGIIYGDYVLDAQQRIYQKMVGSKTYRSARSIDDLDLENTESNSYETLWFSIEEFNELTTPDNLFNALPEVIKRRFDITGADKQMIVNILNQVLTQYDLIESVAAIQEIDLTADELVAVKISIHNLSAEEILIVNRLFLSENFKDTCPEAWKNPDDIAFILPLFSCYLGGNEVDNTDDTEMSRVVSTYSDYTAKKNAIEKSFRNWQTRLVLIYQQIKYQVRILLMGILLVYQSRLNLVLVEKLITTGEAVFELLFPPLYYANTI